MHPAHTLHTSRGRVEPWDTSTRSISTTSFLCLRLWISTCLANNRDLHSFWQHDVLDNMTFSKEFNMFCFDFCFISSTFCWTTAATFAENVNMKRRTTIECSTEAVLFQQCLAFNVFWPTTRTMAANTMAAPPTAVKVTATGEYLTLYEDMETTGLRGTNFEWLNGSNNNWKQEIANKVNDCVEFMATGFTWKEYNSLVNKEIGTVPTSTNHWPKWGKPSTVICGLFNSPSTWSTSTQRTHHWLGHFNNVFNMEAWPC